MLTSDHDYPYLQRVGKGKLVDSSFIYRDCGTMHSADVEKCNHQHGLDPLEEWRRNITTGYLRHQKDSIRKKAHLQGMPNLWCLLTKLKLLKQIPIPVTVQ